MNESVDPPEIKTLRAAIQSGIRDENRLTDMTFNVRHPERGGKKLQPNEQKLAQEWIHIRDRLVRPALQAPSAGTTPAVHPQPAAGAHPASTTSGVEAA